MWQVAGNASMDALTANRSWQPSCSHGTYQHETITSRSLQLLMMGIWLPETCWATSRREIKNTSVTSSWFFLSTTNIFCISRCLCLLPHPLHLRVYIKRSTSNWDFTWHKLILSDSSPDPSCTAPATCSIYPIVPRESAAWQHCCWEPGAICIYITTLTAGGRHKVFMSCDINPNSGAVLACKFSSNYYSPTVHDSSLLLTVPSSGKQKCTAIFI